MTDYYDEQVKTQVKHKMRRAKHEWEPDPRGQVDYVEREEEDGRRFLFLRIRLRRRPGDDETPSYLRRDR